MYHSDDAAQPISIKVIKEVVILYMFVNPSNSETLHGGTEFVDQKITHEMYGSLLTLMLDFRVIINEMARINNGTRDSWISRGL